MIKTGSLYLRQWADLDYEIIPHGTENNIWEKSLKTWS
jgi:hypothetical protein